MAQYISGVGYQMDNGMVVPQQYWGDDDMWQKAVPYEQAASMGQQVNAPQANAFEGLTGYQGTAVTRGLRGTGGHQYGDRDLGGENATWVVNPATGKEEIAFVGPDSRAYLASDLMKKYGSVDAIRNAGFNVDVWGARQSNDFLSGKDGLHDAITIAAMAAPVVAGAAGLYGAAAGGTGEAALAGSGGAALAGGGEVGSGYAASAPGAAGATNATGDAAIVGGTGTDAMTGGAVDDWWTEMGLTAGDVGMESTPFTTDPSYADLGGPDYGGGGFDAAAYAKQYGPAALQGLLRAFPGLAGAYAANKQTGALQNLAGQYANYGAPSRARYEASMAPGFDPMSIPGYSGAVDTASKSLLARLSATGGNPYGNPGGLIDANKQIISGTALPAIQGYQNLNAGTGFGSTLGASGQMAGQAIGSQGNMYNAIGAGLNDVFNPPQTLAEQLASLRLQNGGVNSKYSL